MSQVNPIKQTTNREEIEAKLDHLYDREGVINRKFPDEPTIHDLIYDELRNLNGAIASLSTGNDIYLKALVDNTGTTAVNLRDVKNRLKEIIHLSGNVRDNTAVMSEHLESVDERLVEANNLLTDTRDKKPIVEGDYGEPLMTQKDIDAYMESVKDYYVFDDTDEVIMKKVEFSKAERHILYRALGSRASTLRNQIGYTRVNNDGTLRDQITKCEKLIRKIKDS